MARERGSGSEIRDAPTGAPVDTLAAAVALARQRCSAQLRWCVATLHGLEVRPVGLALESECPLLIRRRLVLVGRRGRALLASLPFEWFATLGATLLHRGGAGGGRIHLGLAGGHGLAAGYLVVVRKDSLTNSLTKRWQ